MIFTGDHSSIGWDLMIILVWVSKDFRIFIQFTPFPHENQGSNWTSCRGIVVNTFLAVNLTTVFWFWRFWTEEIRISRRSWKMGQIAILENAFLNLQTWQTHFLTFPWPSHVRILNSGRLNDSLIGSTGQLGSSWDVPTSGQSVPLPYQKSRCQNNWNEWWSPTGTQPDQRPLNLIFEPQSKVN